MSRLATKGGHFINTNATDTTREAKVYYDTEWEEYQVRLIVNGVVQRKATYHTDDKDDALGTAKLMAKFPA